MYGVEELREGLLHPYTGSELPLVVYEDPCRSRYGVLKLKLVRKYYGANIDEDTIPLIKSHFVEWRDTVELLPMRLTRKKAGFMDLSNTATSPEQWLRMREDIAPGLVSVPFNDNPKCQLVSYEHLTTSWVNKKSVKRGNDVYIELLKDKFAPLLNSSNHIDFFSTALNEHRNPVRRTRMLYLTGTCDQAKTGDIVASWVAFGAYWNHFITSVRDIFGKAAYIRTWQSQDNGYPHFHTLIYFKDFEFTATPWKEKDGSTSWRIHNRQKVTINRKTGEKDYCRDVLKDLWKWGNLDVKCCDSSKQALTDLLKYVLRDLEGGASDLTNAMVWYFMKKSFALSRGFVELFGAFEEPENADLINAEGVTQEGTQEGELVAIDIFPTIPRDLMPFYQQLTLDRLVRPPDPPPEMVEFLENFALSCAPATSRKRDDGVVVTVYKYREGFE